MCRNSAAATCRVVIVVAMVLLAPTVGPLSSMADTARAAAGDDQQFAVAQGTTCFVSEPVENASKNVSAFYDYRNPETTPAGFRYSSYGTTEYQRALESSLLFYAGPNDTSLVFLHGRLDGDGAGSTATYDITGLPDGEWAVRDDQYTNPDDEWDIGTNQASIDWKWSEGRTDGGAYRGLDSLNSTVVIDPGYNEAGDAWGEWNRSGSPEHRVTDWIVHSGDGSTRSLALDRRVFIHAGDCAETPPNASLSRPAGAQPGESITFDAGATVDDGAIGGYEWDFDADGETDAVTTDATAQHSFPDVGRYNVSVTAFDTYGNADTATVTVVVGNPDAPDANLTVTPASVLVNESVTLDASGSTDNGTILEYRWDLDGDGTIDDTTTNATRTTAFERADEYDVAVTVVDDTNDTATATATVTVTPDQPPTAAVNASDPVAAGESVTFDASGSRDDRGIVRYEWDFDGDGETDANTSDPTASFAYDAAGEYEPNVTVVDETNQTATARTTVRVGIDAALSVPDTVPVGRQVTLDASGSTVGGPNVTYRWDPDGDGDFEGPATDSPTLTYTYNETGEYEPGVRVTDGANVTVTASATVTVRTVEDLSAPANTTVGRQITLDASGSAIGGTNVTYEWDVDGDGEFEGNATASPTTTHAYAVNGTYTPRVRISNDEGDTLTATATVRVAAEPTPTIDPEAESADVNETLTFRGSTGTENESAYTLQWRFGDSASASGTTVRHAYDEGGRYTVTLRVLMDDGAVASTSLPVTVNESDGGSGGDAGSGNSGGGGGGGDGGDGGGGNSGGPSGGGGGNPGGSSDSSPGGTSGTDGDPDDSDGGSDSGDGSTTEGTETPEPVENPEPNYSTVTVTYNTDEMITGDTLVVMASVNNTGNGSGTKTIEFEIDGEIVDQRQFVLQPNESRTVRFTWTFDQPGEYTIRIDTTKRFRVTVSPPRPNISVTDLRVSNDSLAPGEEITFTAVLVNEGRATGTRTVSLTLFNETVAVRNVTVPAGTRKRVTFTRSIAAEGEYRATIGNLSATVNVSAAAATSPDGGGSQTTSTTTPGFGVPAGLLAVAGAAVLLARRRRR